VAGVPTADLPIPIPLFTAGLCFVINSGILQPHSELASLDWSATLSLGVCVPTPR
jgi:hypothetical protein